MLGWPVRNWNRLSKSRSVVSLGSSCSPGRGLSRKARFFGGVIFPRAAGGLVSGPFRGMPANGSSSRGTPAPAGAGRVGWAGPGRRSAVLPPMGGSLVSGAVPPRNPGSQSMMLAMTLFPLGLLRLALGAGRLGVGVGVFLVFVPAGRGDPGKGFERREPGFDFELPFLHVVEVLGVRWHADIDIGLGRPVGLGRVDHGDVVGLLIEVDLEAGIAVIARDFLIADNEFGVLLVDAPGRSVFRRVEQVHGLANGGAGLAGRTPIDKA